MNNSPLLSMIIDDNQAARVTMKKMLEKIPDVQIVKDYSDVMEAKTFLETNRIDLLFLDIEMPEMNGLDLLRLIPNPPLTILITAKEDYAVEAFELNVVDYIVKPLTLPRTISAIERAKELNKMRQLDSVSILSTGNSNHIFIKENKTIRKIDIKDILWIEAKGDYVQIQLPNKKHVIYGSLKTLEDKLQDIRFVRVHRSYIISLDKVDYIEDRTVYINGEPIPISETYKDTLLQKLKIL